jgi:hypothetical protein
MKQYKGTGMISPVFSFKMFHSKLVDDKNVQCLDAVNGIRFGLAR